MLIIDPISIMLACLCALVGTLIGRKVQTIVNFAYPCDPITVAIIAIPIIITCYASANNYGEIVFLMIVLILFYFVGYYFNGRQNYTYIVTLDSGTTSRLKLAARPWVIYENDKGQTCRQDHSWKALWYRWRYGIHHIIVTRSDLNPNVDLDVQSYLLPAIKGSMIFVEYMSDSTNIHDVKYSRKMVKDAEGKYVPKRVKRVAQTITTLVTSYTTGISALDFVFQRKAFAELSEQCEKQAEMIYQYQSKFNIELISSFGELLKGEAAKTPGAKVFGTLGYKNDSKKEEGKQ